MLRARDRMSDSLPLVMHAVQTRLRQNLDALQQRVDAARARGPHSASAVELLVITKSAPIWLFPHLEAAGVAAVGENRVQAAAERREASPPRWTWHGIGHLQRNKAALAVRTFDVFHALDSDRLANRLEAVLTEAGRVWPVYVQVNAAEDPAKSGVEPDEALAFLERVLAHDHLDVQGFMTMARLGAAEDDVRATFSTLRAVRDEAVRRGIGASPPSGLSMGMTDDFETAIEEGATIVRVGRAVFEGVPLDEDEARRREEERA